jgi:hypothetical protein
MSKVYIFDYSSTPFHSGEQRDILVVDRERIGDVAKMNVTFMRPGSLLSWFWSSDNHLHYVSIFKVTVTSAEDGRRYLHFVFVLAEKRKPM